MRQVHKAGEKLFIDYCGPTIAIVDAQTGEVLKAQVFVACWGASNYTYAEATRTQSGLDCLSCECVQLLWRGARGTGAG